MHILGSTGTPPLTARVCYSVAVAAWNNAGVGAFSNMISAQQRDARPGPPLIVAAVPCAYAPLWMLKLFHRLRYVTMCRDVCREYIGVGVHVCMCHQQLIIGPPCFRCFFVVAADAAVAVQFIESLYDAGILLAPFLVMATPIAPLLPTPAGTAIPVFTSVPVRNGFVNYSCSIDSLVNGQLYAIYGTASVSQCCRRRLEALPRMISLVVTP